MDPFRPTPYSQYRPGPAQYPPYGAPPLQYSQQPPRGLAYGAPQPYRGGPPPGRGGYMPQPLGARPPPALGQPPVVDIEKLTTLFIGGIPPGISDAWMEKVLKTCGVLNKWKRVKDQGNLQKFGFAEYADPEGVLRALRVIGGEGPLEAPMFSALDGSNVTKKLIVKADDATRTYLNQHEESRPKTVHDEELDKTAWKTVKEIIASMLTSPDPGAQSPSATQTDAGATGSPKPGEAQHDEESDLPPDLPPEQKELITKEIAFFRERAAQRERERKRGEEERQRAKEQAEQERQRMAERERQREREREQREQRFQVEDRDAKAIQAFVRERRESVELDDEEGERRRQEQRQKEQEIGFREREKRWEHRESNRIRGYEREALREQEIKEREIKAREEWAIKLANFNDDVEAERGEEEYYRDRTLWIHDRASARQREKELDDRDRAREQEEIEEAKRKQEREQQQRLTNGGAESESLDTMITDANSVDGVSAASSSVPMDQTAMAKRVVRTKFNFNMALKRRAPVGVGKSGTPAEEDEDDEELAERKKRRVLVPLDYDDDDIKGVGETKTAAAPATHEVSAEERRRLVTELVDEIRAAQEGVWKWNVKWDELDETILATKLQPFVAKQIIDLLGVQEDELTSFVMDHVRNRRAPEELVSELEVALDEEAPTFVMKLWRRLIFETESKSRKL